MFVSPVLSLSLSLSFLHDLWVLVLLVLLVLRSEVGERRLASVLLLPVPPRNQLVCLCVCVYFWRGGGGRLSVAVRCPMSNLSRNRTHVHDVFHHFRCSTVKRVCVVSCILDVEWKFGFGFASREGANLPQFSGYDIDGGS